MRERNNIELAMYSGGGEGLAGMRSGQEMAVVRFRAQEEKLPGKEDN